MIQDDSGKVSTEQAAGAAKWMHLREISGLFRAYAAILFLDNPVIGLIFIMATFWFPNIGFSGLLGALVGLITARLLHLPHLTSGMYIYNSLLVGLSLGAFYELDVHLALLIFLSAALAVFLAAALSGWLWQMGQLPVLSLPFVLVALAAAAAAKSYGTLSHYLGTYAFPGAWFGEWIDAFLMSLGSTFFSPHPLAGLVLIAGIAWRSRYLALLCIAGFAVGDTFLHYLTAKPDHDFARFAGFNFALTAMAVGGIFTVPGVTGFLIALVAAALAALLTAALSNTLLIYGLPVMAVPFVLTTLIVLAGLRIRAGYASPRLLLEKPGLPEVNYERERMNRVRMGESGSIALLAPCFGEWQVYQGFNGSHTHKDAWRHALDFYITEDERSFREQGTRLEDYRCFGLPVLSPVNGIVVRVSGDLPDNPPGEMDVRNNWGNFVLIRLYSGLHVLLAHLHKDSLKVKEGDQVTPESVIGACGNSGRSPQPHIHLQVQQDARLGSATVPFHLASVIHHTEEKKPEYRLVCLPEAGDYVQRAEKDTRLAAPLHMPVGRCLRFRYQGPDKAAPEERELHVEVTLLGQFRLVSDRGASTAFEEASGVIAFYDRQGLYDPLLDLWLLAMGVTPLTDRAHEWRDAPLARLLPLTPLQKLWLAIWRPLGTGLDSHYERNFDDHMQAWCQRGTHCLRAGFVKTCAETEAVLDTEHGCVHLSMKCNNDIWTADLLEIGQLADRGVPAWAEIVPGRDVSRNTENSGSTTKTG